VNSTFYINIENVTDHPVSCHESTDGEERYGFTISLTSTLGGGRVFKATHRPLYPRERDTVPPVQETGGGGSQGRSGRVRKTSPSPGFDPGPSSPYRVTTQTELTRLNIRTLNQVTNSRYAKATMI